MIAIVLCLFARARADPALFFGPTAALRKGPLSELVDGLVTRLDQWSTLRQLLNDTGGALHLRRGAVMDLDPTQLATLGSASTSIGLRISIEGGGAMCGNGSGVERGTRDARVFEPFFAAGGRLSHWLLESVYSRSRAGCPSQSHATTTTELASYAATVHAAIRRDAPVEMYLYEALPHFRVGAAWPANVPSYGLELGATLAALKPAMAAKGVPLAGYWADCPYEYSRDYPNASAPMPAGSGFRKLAAAVALVHAAGLKVAKTLNSQAGGQASDEAFYDGTMADWDATAAAVPAGSAGWDALMVETWYPHPADAIPERGAYTTAYTALAVFQKVGRVFAAQSSRDVWPSNGTMHEHV
jgi:hypothetical protein